jgi:hypothetical protein
VRSLLSPWLVHSDPLGVQSDTDHRQSELIRDTAQLLQGVRATRHVCTRWTHATRGLV